MRQQFDPSGASRAALAIGVAFLAIGVTTHTIDMRSEKPDFVATRGVDTTVKLFVPSTIGQIVAPATINTPAEAVSTVGAVRVDVPVTITAPTTTWVMPEPRPMDATPCELARQLLIDYAPSSGWDVDRMMRYVRRESGDYCDVDAYNRRGQAVGWLQLTPVNHPFLREALGEWVDRWTLVDPVQNIRAGAALFTYWHDATGNGYLPWAT